jgi:hypothetical protein
VHSLTLPPWARLIDSPVTAAISSSLNRQPLAVGVEGLCLELDQERHDLPAILPGAIQMLELPQWIALIEVNIMHAQITAGRRAKDEDAHTPQ